MCGRYTITITIEELMAYYFADVPNVRYHIPRYNVAPMQRTPVVTTEAGKNIINEMRWGLVPVWAKDDKIGNKMINARSETVADKPAFRSLLMRKRCLIPADGFYEWQKRGSAKQPFRIVLKHRDIFSFAGLFDTWTTPEGGTLSTCTIITTSPNELMADIHDRMPVILRREDEALWAEPSNQDKDLLLDMLKPYEADEMRAYPVGTAVGNVSNNYAELIEEVV